MPLATASTLTPNLILRGDLLLVTPTALAAVSGAPNTLPQGGFFTFAPAGGGEDITLLVSAEGVVSPPTTLTANLLVSDNNGLTWQTYATALALVTAAVAATQNVLHLTPGRLYGISLATLTLGATCTGVNIYVSAS